MWVGVHMFRKTQEEYLQAMAQGRRQYDELYALKDVSLDIMPGDFYGLVGLNGSGKSTLLKTIAGVYKPTKGQGHRQRHYRPPDRAGRRL